MTPLVLYVDDERPNLDVFVRCFDEELSIVTASSAAEAMQHLEREEIGVLVTDQRMPEQTGIELLEKVAARWPLVSRLLLSAYSDRDLLLSAIQRGHVGDYVLKPWSEEDLRIRLGAAMQGYLDRRAAAAAVGERDRLRLELDEARGFSALVGLSSLQPSLQRIAAAGSPVLVTGEPGTGKSRVAAALHGEQQGPFLTLRCVDAIDAIDARLRGRHALPELAAGGTLYLSHVDELPGALHGLLLEVVQRIVEERAVRLVASASQPLEALAMRGRFRPDLAGLLTVHHVELPPLRTRGTDLLELTRAFLAEQIARLGKPLTISEDALRALGDYDWPGNVRELRNAIERAAVLADPGAVLERDDFIVSLDAPGADVYAQIDRDEADKLRAALQQASGNKARTARLLGIPRTTLNDRLRKHGLG